MRGSRGIMDLTGQRFGHLVVLEPAERRNGRTAWRCLCDCGRETVVISSHLRSGHTASCGCMCPGGKPDVNLPGLTYVDGTCVEMLRAKTVRRNNTSGVPGVDWRADKGLWRASICFKGKRHYLGGFHRFEDAVRARKQAEEALHDRFVREFSESPAQQTASR